MLREGLTKAVQEIIPVEFGLPNGQRVSLSVKDAVIYPPAVPPSSNCVNLKVYPAESRERGTTYRGKLNVQLLWTVDGVKFGPEERAIGVVPIMVKSAACNLAGLSPLELIKHGEEAEEMGGYFIVNGIERIIRMLVMPRRNYPLALARPSWKNRGALYTEFGVSLRSVNHDQTSSTIVLHYLNNGTCTLSFTYNKEQFFVPIILILKALLDTTDEFIYRELTRGRETHTYYKGCITNMLRQTHEEQLTRQSLILRYIGSRFRIKLGRPSWYSDTHVANFLLKHCVCVHLSEAVDKFNLLVHMTQKLFTFVAGECTTENPDNPMFQEALLSGHLYQMVLKEKVESWLFTLRTRIELNAKNKGPEFILDEAGISSACRHSMDVTKSMEYFLATGNLVSRTGLGLMQVAGLTVVADKLNFFRYVSHFRCIHRGAFFAQMRTTAVRKLLPEAWGFLCPVHTPDGAPCGLMNHLSASCQIVNVTYETSHMTRLLCVMGMVEYNAPPHHDPQGSYPVCLDGRLIGWLHSTIAKDVAERLRILKVKGLERVSMMLEICFVGRTQFGSQYPGLYLFLAPARLMRPVRNLATSSVEMIGTFEQCYLNICVTPSEAHQGETTHEELSEFSMLSTIASLTPFSDFNQSPRNMYQCQMGKQTMGTPLHALGHRSDNKLYKLQTPQSPLVRPAVYDFYHMDEYPLGTNAVVAVISYTGYDMEDAMILNKSSFERGFAYGTIYKSEFINLKDKSQEKYRISLKFGCPPDNKRTLGRLDPDGLPPVGTYLTTGDPYYSYVNIQTGEVRVENYKGAEPAYVEMVKILGADNGAEQLQKVCILLRIERNPVIGDKFSSRHGQKGICSQKWPVEDMPFTESGMQPDIIFNPHGFPSRMTIGMMIESMAGKSSAMHGLCHDATPFTFSEDQPAIDYFGNLLTAAGYNYYGTERMYSGVDGRELEADIFVGVVYYQRLRHMVSDKFQVRATGPIDSLTHQPVKGRKRAGGVRFGEMERDALIAHGTAFLLQDRLLNCSDKCLGHVCSNCGSILSPLMGKPVMSNAASSFEATRAWMCSVCQLENTVEAISIPYVFRYLVAELAAMNIKVTLDVK
ncbi:hypothetical protein NP493_591g01025 [Ridgeia piscesae]|uniref:DNA-directed RNA polymerase subunit beta n=1 Tax=Ridgeia piscesae TaxID=27915 RepID=A0AAD9KU52_RIDPI|nr:hypothetical protein NP493_591g01025 [Ridgeia piscesae]